MKRTTVAIALVCGIATMQGCDCPPKSHPADGSVGNQTSREKVADPKDEDCAHNICKRAYRDPVPGYVVEGDTYCTDCKRPGDQLGWHNAWKCVQPVTGTIELKERHLGHPQSTPDGFVFLRESNCFYYPIQPSGMTGWLLQRASELPIDSMTVCEESPVPTGYSITSPQIYCEQCEDKGSYIDPVTHQRVHNPNAKVISKDQR